MPSIVTGLVIVGRSVGKIDRTPVPGIANVMVSGPACAFASRIACRNEPAPLSLVVVTTNVVGPTVATVVVVVAELLAVLGSVPLAVTVAVFDRGPAAVGVTTMLTVTAAPLAIEPSGHVTVVVPLQPPREDVAETNVTVAGSTSVTTALLEASGPALVTEIRYVSGEPTATGFGEACSVMPRFALPAVPETCAHERELRRVAVRIGHRCRDKRARWHERRGEARFQVGVGSIPRA